MNVDQRTLRRMATAAAEHHAAWRKGEPMLDAWCAIVGKALDEAGIKHPYMEPSR